MESLNDFVDQLTDNFTYASWTYEFTGHHNQDNAERAIEILEDSKPIPLIVRSFIVSEFRSIVWRLKEDGNPIIETLEHYLQDRIANHMLNNSKRWTDDKDGMSTVVFKLQK